jgi:hypothetical protein
LAEEKGELLKSFYPSLPPLPPDKRGELLKYFLGNDQQLQVKDWKLPVECQYSLSSQSPQR